MASNPYNAILTGIAAELVGDPTLMTAIGGTADNLYKTFATIVRLDALVDPPYLVYGIITDIPDGTFEDPTKMEDATFYVNIFNTGAAGIAALGLLADKVMDVLDNATLTVAGYACMSCLREFTSETRYDTDTATFGLTIRYRLLVDTN